MTLGFVRNFFPTSLVYLHEIHRRTNASGTASAGRITGREQSHKQLCCACVPAHIQRESHPKSQRGLGSRSGRGERERRGASSPPGNNNQEQPFKETHARERRKTSPVRKGRPRPPLPPRRPLPVPCRTCSALPGSLRRCSAERWCRRSRVRL